MLSPNEIRLLADKCVEIGDELADPDGFVSARVLSDRFDADLVLRPLLVEGMLASVETAEFQDVEHGSNHKWAVLLDSESYSSITENDVNNEDTQCPLPCRLRNTIAHELVHSFAFRSNEFGVELTTRKNAKVTKREFVEGIERDTEKLSPFLLVPNKYLAEYFATDKKDISIQDLKVMRQRMGVSRYVLISRLKLLRLVDKSDLLIRQCLINFAVGIGEWISDKEARFKDWPIFYNFHRNIVPEFILNTANGKLPSLVKVFNEPLFSLCGGDADELEIAVRGGTLQLPRAEEMKVTCAIEPVSRRKGSEFLFIVRST